MEWLNPYLHRLLDRYMKTEILHLYACFSAMAGTIDSSFPNGEQDWRDPNQALPLLQRYFPTAS
jgi:hypothetical protein